MHLRARQWPLVTAWTLTVFGGLPAWYATGLWLSMDSSWSPGPALVARLAADVVLLAGPLATAARASNRWALPVALLIAVLFLGWDLAQVLSLARGRA